MSIITKLLFDGAQKIVSYPNYKARYLDGNRDLKKGLSNSLPISKEQKEEILSFWKEYLINRKSKHAFNIKWYDVYNKTNVFGAELKYYIPDSYYYCIVDDFFSNYKEALALDDKNLYDLFFNDVAQPRTICRKESGVFLDSDYHIITESKAISLCEKNFKVICKPSVDALGGRGICYWDGQKSDVSSLRSILKNADSLVVQDVIKQHSVLAAFNDSSVNTLRLVTLLFGGEVHLVTAVTILGGKDSLTNHLHGGGLVCGILPTGQLRDTAFNGNLMQYHEHPASGVAFADCIIPNYEKCVSLVKGLAPRLSRVSKLLSWDLTIGENGEPVLIEVNLSWGGSVQIAGGPVFGDMTKEVLNTIKKG